MKVWQAGAHLTTSARPASTTGRGDRPAGASACSSGSPVRTRPNRARDRHPRRLHARRAPSAVPREARRRRRDRAGRPRCAHRRRRRLPRGRHRRPRSRGRRPTITGWVGERALADLRIQLFDHLQRLSLGYYERNRTGAIISRITNDVEALDQLVTDGISSLVQNSPCPGNGGRPVHPRLASRARDPRRPSAHGRDGVVSGALEPRVPSVRERLVS